MSKKLELYVYTTSTWKEKGLVKVGHSSKGRCEHRIKKELGANSPELPIILWIQELPKGKQDHDVHRQLEENGINRKRDGRGREWFCASLDDVKIAYNQIKYGKKRKLDYQLRKNQIEAVNQAVNWFNNPKGIYPERFLLNAKIRFGKSFTTMSIVKKIKSKKNCRGDISSKG